MKKTKRDYIRELTENREFKTGKGWVSGGINHYTLPMLKELYAVSRPKNKDKNKHVWVINKY